MGCTLMILLSYPMFLGSTFCGTVVMCMLSKCSTNEMCPGIQHSFRNMDSLYLLGGGVVVLFYSNCRLTLWSGN